MSTSSRLPTPQFIHGQTVYLRVNASYVGMITGILFRPGGVITYLVTWSEGAEEKDHWLCELSADKFWQGEENDS